MRPNPIDMLVFLEVAEARSFSAAAARLGKTTSAVSQAVSRLEEDLGLRLFYRTTRRLSLTEAGTRTLSHCREMNRVYGAAKADANDSQEDPAGLLTVTGPHALCATLLAPALAKLSSQHEGLSVRLIADDAPVDMVEQQVDLAIRVGKVTQGSGRMTRIGSLNEALYCSEDYLAQRGGVPSSLEDLGSWDHIGNEWQGSPLAYKGPGQEVLRVKPRYRCNSVLDVRQFVAAGAGVGLLPEPVANAGLRPLFPIATTPIYAVHLFEGRAPAKVRALIGLLKQSLRAA